MMELQCPQCGKWMAVSREELVIHGSQVVCPQCLAVCRYEGDKLVVRDDSDAPYRHTATVTDSEPGGSKFCHSCGKQLPGGISFCPYCGADLKAPFSNDGQQPALKPAAPVAKKSTNETTPSPEPTPTPPGNQSSQVEAKLRSMPHRYSDNGLRLHQNGTMPGTAFKVVAYSIIALLTILLIYIIIAGASIENAL